MRWWFLLPLLPLVGCAPVKPIAATHATLGVPPAQPLGWLLLGLLAAAIVLIRALKK